MKLFIAMIYISNFVDFTFDEIAESVAKIRDSLNGAIKIISSLPEVLIVLFPFLETDQIAYLVFLIFALLVTCGYFFLKKVV